MHNRSMRTEARVLVRHHRPAGLSRRVFYSSRFSFRLPQCVSLGHSPSSFLVRYPSMALQASSASASVLKGEPATLMAPIF